MKKFVILVALIAMGMNAFAMDNARLDEKQTIKIGDKMIDFEFADLGGIKAKTEELRKGKYFILSFIKDPGFENAAENTVPLNAVAKYFENKAVVLELVLLEKTDEQKAIAFYEKTAPVYTPAFDFEGKIAQMYGVVNTPLIIIVNEKGEVVMIHRRFANPILIQRAIEDEMNGVPPENRF